MYAVIETGGKQYRVEVGTELQVELLDVEPGKTITLDRVLLVADGDTSSIGQPLVADAAVSAEVVRQIRGEKLISFKYRPKARSRVKKGHRQELTVLRISDITLDGKSAAKSAKKTQDDAKTERQRLEEAATVQAAKDAELAAKLAAGAEGATTATKAKSKAAMAETKPAATEPAKTEPAKTEPAERKPAATKPAATKATESQGAAKPKTSAATKAKAKAATKAKPATKAKAAPKTEAKTEPKPSRSKASDAPAKAADAPKRTRATKKDE